MHALPFNTAINVADADMGANPGAPQIPFTPMKNEANM